MQRARNRRGGQRQHVDVRAHLFQALFVRDAEALLFVDDQQAEIVKLYVFRKQPVRADDDVHLACFEHRREFPFARAALRKRLSISTRTGNAAKRRLKVS